MLHYHEKRATEIITCEVIMSVGFIGNLFMGASVFLFFFSVYVISLIQATAVTFLFWDISLWILPWYTWQVNDHLLTFKSLEPVRYIWNNKPLTLTKTAFMHHIIHVIYCCDVKAELTIMSINMFCCSKTICCHISLGTHIKHLQILKHKFSLATMGYEATKYPVFKVFWSHVTALCDL